MTLTDFLIWLVVGGSIIAVSWAFERMNWYQVLSSNAKQWVFFGACAVVSLSSYYVQTYVPVANLQALAPVFQILAGLFIALFLGNQFHAKDSNAAKPVAPVATPPVVNPPEVKP